MPAGVEARIDGEFIIIKGSKGELKQKLHSLVKVVIENNVITVSPSNVEEKGAKAFWGLYRSLLKNMVEGVSKGFEKKLEINGVGYKVTGGGQKLTLALGFSHKITYTAPEGITIKMADDTNISITGCDKQMVGQVASEIRALRKPEPYKGKGIRYLGEEVKRKAGKTAASK